MINAARSSRVIPAGRGGCQPLPELGADGLPQWSQGSRRGLHRQVGAQRGHPLRMLLLRRRSSISMPIGPSGSAGRPAQDASSDASHEQLIMEPGRQVLLQTRHRDDGPARRSDTSRTRSASVDRGLQTERDPAGALRVGHARGVADRDQSGQLHRLRVVLIGQAGAGPDHVDRFAPIRIGPLDQAGHRPTGRLERGRWRSRASVLSSAGRTNSTVKVPASCSNTITTNPRCWAMNAGPPLRGPGPAPGCSRYWRAA